MDRIIDGNPTGGGGGGGENLVRAIVGFLGPPCPVDDLARPLALRFEHLPGQLDGVAGV